MSVKKYAFFCPQGTLLLKDNLYIQRQGTTAENGGQLIYTIEMAQALAEQGHIIDIYARNYGNADYDHVLETITEDMPGFPNVRIHHVPTSADASIQKEEFYPFYAEYLTRALNHIKGQEYDFVVGHYADGIFMAAAAEEYLYQEDGKRRTLLGITHSLGKEKSDSLITKIKADPKYREKARADIYLTEEFHQAVHGFNIMPRLACERGAFSRMDGMVPISHEHHRSLFDDYNYPEDQMDIIPGGINQRVFHPLNHEPAQKIATRAQLIEKHINLIGEERRDLVQDGKIVLGFGRLVVAKGVVEAVKSMKSLLARQPDAVYIYIGGNIPPENPEEIKVYEESMRYAQAGGYADRIIFLGRQDQQTINQWLNVSDIYLHSAHLEPFGLAPQEAASTGIPVVMSKYAGACDVLKNNQHVLHTDPHNPEDIAKQVARFIENPYLADRLSKEAVNTVRQNCTWFARAQDLHDFATEATEKYFPLRAVSSSVTTEEGIDDIHAARALLFQRTHTVVGEEARDTYDQVKGIFEQLLSSRTDRTNFPGPYSPDPRRDLN